jgi:hypothetical protein
MFFLRPIQDMSAMPQSVEARTGNHKQNSTKLAQGRAELVGRDRTDNASHLLAIFKKDRRGPEFYSEGAAERAARAVFDFDVADGRLFGERFGDGRRCGLAMAAPPGAEFQQDRTLRCVDFFARGTRVFVLGGHKPCIGLLS